MMRWMLLALTALGCLMGPALAQPGDGKKDDKAEMFPAPPKGFDAENAYIEYLKLKSFIVWKESSLKKSLPADLGKTLATDFKNTYPLVAWLRQIG